MNARLDTAFTEARIALSADAQDVLADLIATYVATHATTPDFTEAELAELKRRHDGPSDPAPEAGVREFFVRHRD